MFFFQESTFRNFSFLQQTSFYRWPFLLKYISEAALSCFYLSKGVDSVHLHSYFWAACEYLFHPCVFAGLGGQCAQPAGTAGGAGGSAEGLGQESRLLH